MREGWMLATLGNVCQIKPPRREAKQRLADSDLVSFVPMKDLGQRKKNLILKEERPLSKVVGSYTYFADNDVLLAKITPCFENGKLGIARNLINGVGFGSSEYVVFRSRGETDPEYLFYFLSQDSFRDDGARVMTGAVGHKRVPKEFIENYPISVPLITEQKRIVVIIDEAFEGIDKAVANVEKNFANARELFDSYLNKVFAQKGDRWVEKKFGGVCNFVRGPFGGSLKKSCFVSDGYAVYEQQHAINNQFDRIRYFVDDQKFLAMERFELLTGDLIMSCSGTMGRVAIVPAGVKRGIINQALLKLSPIKSLVPEFLKYWMESESFQEQIKMYSQGAAIKNVASVKILKEIVVPCPNADEQNKIISKLENYHDKTCRLETIYQRKLTALRELKQSLLQKAFAGELTKKATPTKKKKRLRHD